MMENAWQSALRPEFGVHDDNEMYMMMQNFVTVSKTLAIDLGARVQCTQLNCFLVFLSWSSKIAIRLNFRANFRDRPQHTKTGSRNTPPFPSLN